MIEDYINNFELEFSVYEAIPKSDFRYFVRDRKIPIQYKGKESNKIKNLIDTLDKGMIHDIIPGPRHYPTISSTALAIKEITKILRDKKK